MARVYISIGSNIDPAENIRAAVDALRQIFSALVLSTVYESEAVGFEGENFYNLVAGFETAESVHQVANILRRIEDEQARNRQGPRFSSRTIDLDLLLYDDLVINEAGLNIPRDEITDNAFVLWPLAEIAGDVIHPLSGVRLADLWQSYNKDKQALWPIEFCWESSPVCNMV